jgi:PAS domain S-box-containing protein
MTESSKSTIDDLFETSIPGASLESILCTEELHRRPSRAPDHEKENTALVALAIALADSRQTILQTLAETILQVTESDSSGVSLLTTEDGGKRFYWPAIAGMWKPHIGGGTPRDFGPCGDVLDRNSTLLFKHFERRYTYFLPITPLIEECLLVPFYVGGKAVGTIWAIMHSDRRKFDVEDERLMSVLGQFASLAYQTLESIEDLKLQMAAREKAEAAVRELANGLEAQVRARTQDLEHSTRDLLDTNEALEREIAERKRAKEALQVRELNLRLLVDSIPAPVAVMMASGEVESVNQPLLEYFGKTFEDLKNWGTSDAVHPDDLPHAIRVWMEAIQTGQPYDVKERLRRFDGVYRWFGVRGFPLRDPDGRILNWCVLLTDIDDRQRAEEALRASERNLSLNINAMPTLLASARPDGWGDFFNQRWLDYTGLPAGQLEGWGWATLIHPDDVEGLLTMWRSSLASGTPLQAEARMRRFDGVYRWLLFRANALHDESGDIVKWYGISTDIEDRKRAEGMLAGEKRILEMVARGDSLAEILDSLCRLVEEQDQDVLASVSLVDGNRVRHGGAPSLPKAYKNAIDGIVIGPCAGSCGTAAFRGEQVIVSDIATDPLWADYRDAALPHSLRACWSTPVFSSEGKVIATFAMYYREPRSLSVRDKEIIEQISHLAGVAIQHKQAEERLRRSEAYAAEAQGLSHTGSWHWNVSTGEVAWSEEYCVIFGFDCEKDKPSYQLFIERVHPEDRPKVKQVLWADVREKRDFDGEYRLLFPDGSIKYLHSLGKCSVGQSGDVEYIGAVVDITDHKRAEQELRDSEERHRVVVEAASDAVISMDENGTILLANAAALRVFGYDPTELIGKPLTLLMPEYMRKVHENGFKSYLATGERHINWQGSELTGLRKDGQEFPVEISFGELVKDGRRIFTGFIRDISERKRAEEALRRSESYLAEAQRLTHIGSWAGNILTREIFHSSDEHSRLYGLDPENGIPSFEDLYQRVHPEDQMRLVKTFERASRDGIDVNVHYRVVLRDGTTKHVEAVWHPVLKPSGEAGEFIGFLMDVTERKRAEEERERLRQAQADLAHINRVSTMGELTASLAHEIKQPIAAATTDAKTCLRWLGRDEPNVGEAREAASRLIKDVRRASDIIGRIGTLFRKNVPNRELVDVNEVIQEMMVLLRGEAVRYSISIHGDLASDLPKIMADRVQLQQVLMNLMLNGIEAMKDMGTPGELTIKSEQDENRRIIVAIADTGVGLRPDQTEQVFNAFFTSKPQGTGMGLSISRSIVESHGGRLWASPNSGSGATFQFTLPIEVAALESA